jgi:hypothetical protein
MPDITMNVDETLELDTIVKESDIATDPITNVDSSFGISGFQTHTTTLNPTKPGDYTINVNGQELTVKVNKSNAIPDSAILQYTADTYTTGDSVWKDDIGTSDMSITGDPQTSTLSDGTESVVWDGTGDLGRVTPPSTYEGSSLSAFAVEMELQYAATDAMVIHRAGSGGNTGQLLEMVLNVDSGFNNDAGNLFVRLDDQNDNTLQFAFSSFAGLDDGNKHSITVSFDDPSNNAVTMIVDGSEKSVSKSQTRSPSSFTTWPDDLSFFADSDNNRRYYEGSAGKIRIHDQALAGQTL